MINVVTKMLTVVGLMVTVGIIIFAVMWLINRIADFVDDKKAEKLRKEAVEIEQKEVMQAMQYKVSRIYDYIKEQKAKESNHD